MVASLDGVKLPAVGAALIRRYAEHLESFFAPRPTIPVTIDLAQPGLTSLRYTAAPAPQHIHVVVFTNRHSLLHVRNSIIGPTTAPNTATFSAETVSFLSATGDPYQDQLEAAVELCQGFVKATIQTASSARIDHFWNNPGPYRTPNLKRLHDYRNLVGQETTCNTFGRALVASLAPKATWRFYHNFYYGNPAVQTDLINAEWDLTQAQFLSLRS